MSPIPSSEAKQLPNVATPMGGFAEGSNKTAVELVDRSRRVRRWCLASADAISLLIGIAVATATGTVTEAHLPWLMASLPVWIFTAKLYDLYDRDHRRIQHSTLGEIPPLLATAAITVVVVKVLTASFSASFLPTKALVVIGGTAFLMSLILRSLVRVSYRTLVDPERTIVIGSGSRAAMVSRRIAQLANSGIELTGYAASSSNGTSDGPGSLGFSYLGDTAQLSQIVDRTRATRVVIADPSLDANAIGRLINFCQESRLDITLVPAEMEILGPDTELNRFAGVPMLDFHISVPPRSTLAIKRTIDVVVAGFCLVAMSPFMLIAAVWIKLDSKGPVFFRQARVGKDGRKFSIYKLRTMVADAENQLDDLINLDSLDEPAFKILNDPRVTKSGRFLRRTSLDEVPQFINVLKGHMSLVGPRPEEEAVVVLYDERQRQRLSVKPGLTGPMQVYGRGSLSFEERLALERDYLDNLSVSVDLAILLRTPAAIIKGEGSL